MPSKRLFLFTTQNHFISELFIRQGFETHFITPENMFDFDYNSSTVLVDINKYQLESTSIVLNHIEPFDAEIICIGDNTDKVLKDNLLRHSVIKFINSEEIKMFSSLIFNKVPENDSNSFCIIDQGSNCLTRLNRLFKQFSYDLVQLNHYSQLSETKKDKFSAIFVNINMSEYDITSFVRHCLVSGVPGKCPVIPYRNSSDGINMNGICCGLSKIAKVIMTEKELISFITSFFLKSAFDNCGNKLSSFFDTKNSYADKTFQQLYYELKHEFLAPKIMFNCDKISDLNNAITNLQFRLCQHALHGWLIDDLSLDHPGDFNRYCP